MNFTNSALRVALSLLLLAGLWLVASLSPCFAMQEQAMQEMDHGAAHGQHEAPELKTHPRQIRGMQKYPPDAAGGPYTNFGMQPVHDNEPFFTFMADRLEYQSREGSSALVWDAKAWFGNDYNKLYLESEGAFLLDEEQFEEIEVELLYGRTISSFWNLRAGVRHDFSPEPNRTFAVLGVLGLAPYWFEVDGTAYVSDQGDISAKLELEYEIMLTQRLILQPRFETAFAVQDVPQYGVYSGFNDIELGVRLRYEIMREFAPYVGVSWHRKLGETGMMARAEGEDIDQVSLVAGLRIWF